MYWFNASVVPARHRRVLRFAGGDLSDRNVKAWLPGTLDGHAYAHLAGRSAPHL